MPSLTGRRWSCNGRCVHFVGDSARKFYFFTPIQQSAMDSMTEVLARAVYGLNLNELPLDNLASGMQRPRSISVGRGHAGSQAEIAPPRLSSFSAIFEGPPVPSGSQKRREDRPKRKVGDVMGHRGSLQREEPPSSAKLEEKRFSLPESQITKPRAATMVVMPAISEDSFSGHTSSESRLDEICPSPTSPESVSLVTPYQPLIEEDESGSSRLMEGMEVAEELEKGVGSVEVIMNLNTTSPTHNGQDDVPQLSGSTPSLGSISQERSPDVVRRSLPNIQHHSPEAKHKKGQELVLANQPAVVEEGRSRWRKKWFPGHKRGGSDVTAQIRITELQSFGSEREESPLVLSSTFASGKEQVPPTTKQDKKGVAADHSPPEKPRSFLRKSASDSNLQALLRAHTLPARGTLLLKDDSVLHDLKIRRISSGDPESSLPTSGRDEVPPVVSSSAHRPLRRSLTIDSPEPTPTLTGRQLVQQ